MLIGWYMDPLRRTVDDIIANGFKSSAVPELWDGKAIQRIVKILSKGGCRALSAASPHFSKGDLLHLEP